MTVVGPGERVIIESAAPPIYVFWNIMHKVKNLGSWPRSRVYSAPSGKTNSAVFVTYQSAQDPLPALGLCGDTWLKESSIYVKETESSWILWHPGLKYKFPYETSRVLIWSRNLHFKYLAENSRKSERRRWDGDYLTTKSYCFSILMNGIHSIRGRATLGFHCSHSFGEDARGISGAPKEI